MTSKEWFGLVENRKLREELQTNLDLFPIGKRDREHSSLRDALMFGFDWSCTDQGFKYWDDLYSDIKRNEEKYIQTYTNTISKNYNI